METPALVSFINGISYSETHQKQMSHLLQHLLWGIGVRIRKRHDERETRETMTTHELWKACSCPTRPYKVSARVPKASRSLTNASLAESGRSGFSNGPSHASAVTTGNASSQRIPASSNGPSQASAVITGNASLASQRVPQGVDGVNLPVNEFRIDSATSGSAIQQIDTVISPHVMVSALEIAEPVTASQSQSRQCCDSEGCGCGSNLAFEGYWRQRVPLSPSNLPHTQHESYFMSVTFPMCFEIQKNFRNPSTLNSFTYRF